MRLSRSAFLDANSSSVKTPAACSSPQFRNCSVTSGVEAGAAAGVVPLRHQPEDLFP